jgi:hypothetical protein
MMKVAVQSLGSIANDQKDAKFGRVLQWLHEPFKSKAIQAGGYFEAF